METILTELNYQPCSFDERDMENPEKCFGYFFVNYRLYKVRRNLWEWFKCWVYKEAEVGTTEELEDMLLFYEQLKKLIEAAYVLSVRERRNREQTKSKPNDYENRFNRKGDPGDCSPREA